MKKTVIAPIASLLFLVGALSLQAANVTKLNTTTMNGGATDWSAAPATTDTGEFGATPISTTLAAMTLGGNLTLGGLQFDGGLGHAENRRGGLILHDGTMPRLAERLQAICAVAAHAGKNDADRITAPKLRDALK